ncbi:hypothetical protein BV20DRAFT_177901 [Pilatotrama ljubarskyi]|nr:hypothetical protein BV20DRAFT_177901 [Pilatotrama ljubarskyi]
MYSYRTKRQSLAVHEPSLYHTAMHRPYKLCTRRALLDVHRLESLQVLAASARKPLPSGP